MCKTGERVNEVAFKGEGGRQPVPSALTSLDRIRERCRGRRLAIFLDYDGTMVPIVETPERAAMGEEARRVIEELSARCTLGIISGRDVKDVRRLVNIESIVYAGSHGFQMSVPAEHHTENQVGVDYLPDLDEAERELAAGLAGVSGINVERKAFAIAVHYRNVAQDRVPWVERVVDAMVRRNPRLRKTGGKRVFELRPAMNWHKGKALRWLLQSLHLDGPDVIPFYIGDDVTDEDAFRELAGWGIGIAVQDVSSPTAASYTLRNVAEVLEFLRKLATLCSGKRNESPVPTGC